MTAPFAPPRGDAAALRAHGEDLGRAAAGLTDQTALVERGTQLVELALLNSSSALRIDELRKGMRGLDHELRALRAAGELVADVVRDRASALARLREDLAALDQQARLQPERLADLQREADALRADHRRADQRAGEAVARTTAALGPPATPVAASRSVLAGAPITSRDAWLQVDAAYEAIAEREHRAEQRTFLYQTQGLFEGFGAGAEGTLIGVRDLVLHPLDAGHGFASFLHSVVTDPCGTSRSVWHQVVDPYTDDWREHEYGHAVGRGVEALVEVLVGAKGATKVGALGKSILAADASANLRPIVIAVDGLRLPGVAKDAVGRVAQNQKGWIYPVTPGTPELDRRVVAVRVMDPVDNGRFHYPHGYASYLNHLDQAVNPLTGETLKKTDPFWHIGLTP